MRFRLTAGRLGKPFAHGVGSYGWISEPLWEPTPSANGVSVDRWRLKAFAHGVGSYGGPMDPL
jgi:hypothetical protein